MKFINKILVILIIGLSAAFSAVEAQSINYKAVVKDGSGNLIANDLIQVQFNILKGLVQTNVYSESHTPTTDANGIIIVNIGEGSLVSGSPAYNTLDWASDSHFLQVLINIGDGLVDMGTTEFKTVPYAITSGDKSWDNGADNVHVISKNVGIGTNSPEELLHIYDTDTVGVKLEVRNLADVSKIEFKNGLETAAHSFFKIENRSDRLRFEVASDITSTSGYEGLMDLRYNGLAFNTGTRINEFSSDATLADNSYTAVPTERAVKTYVDNKVNEATLKTIVVPATSFTTNSNDERINYGATGPYVQKFSGNDPLYSPILIPVGSTITSVTFYFRDVNNSANVNIEGSVLSAYRTSFSATVHFTVDTFGSSTTGVTEVYLTPFTTGADRQYYIRVKPTSDWNGTQLGLNCVKITYTEN